MLKFKTSYAVLANLSSNLLNEVGLSLFRYFEVGLRVCDIVVNSTFAIPSPDEFLLLAVDRINIYGPIIINSAVFLISIDIFIFREY